MTPHQRRLGEVWESRNQPDSPKIPLWPPVNYPPFCGMKAKGIGWFRVFGYGLHYKNIRIRGLMFSERYGPMDFWKVGPWIIKVLKPD